MQRTYGRRALRRRSGVQPQTMDDYEPDDPPLSDPSPPRKRHKVFVEIVSPTRKGTVGTHAQNNTQLNINSLKPAETRLEPASGSPKTPERPPRDTISLSAILSHPPSSSHPSRGSIVKRMLGRSRTESSLESRLTDSMCVRVVLILTSSDTIGRNTAGHHFGCPARPSGVISHIANHVS